MTGESRIAETRYILGFCMIISSIPAASVSNSSALSLSFHFVEVECAVR